MHLHKRYADVDKKGGRCGKQADSTHLLSVIKHDQPFWPPGMLC